MAKDGIVVATAKKIIPDIQSVYVKIWVASDVSNNGKMAVASCLVAGPQQRQFHVPSKISHPQTVDQDIHSPFSKLDIENFPLLFLSLFLTADVTSGRFPFLRESSSWAVQKI